MCMFVSGASGAAHDSSGFPVDRGKATLFRELDYCANDGLEVALLWSEVENRLAVSVSDDRSGEAFVLDVESHNALDVYHHPYAHADAAGGCVATARPRRDRE
jgi:hypothetical protein